MKLLNIANKGRIIYLFARDNEGKQIILEDKSYYPFFYEPDPNGKEIGYDGVKLKKIIVAEPYDVQKQKSSASYSSDVSFTKNYVINKIDKFDKTIIKYLFWDIEVLCNELPTYEEPKYTISCITTYNSLSKTVQTWFLKEFKNEEALLQSFVKYIKAEKPDIMIGWNSENFDYPYCYARYHIVTKRDFARDISPINDNRRYFKMDNMNYPAGISMLDYLQLFKKVYMREESYALDYVAQKHLGEKGWERTDFSVLKDDIKLKNINDVKRMVKIEDKYKIIPYFDEIRILTKSLWEDLYFNSYLVESLLFEEAKIKKTVLPNCQSRVSDEEETTFEGATRECINTGVLFDVAKVDLGSAYPNAILNFCLDPQNIIPKEEVCTCGKGEISSGLNCISCDKLRSKDAKAYVNGKYVGQIEINGLTWKQNKEALLPSLIHKVLTLKNTLKTELNKYNPDTEEYKRALIKYDAIKAVVNSCFGVMGNRGFRLYCNEVASTITFLVREVLMYVKDNIEKEGIKVVYWDTDSLFLNTKENNVKRLNELVQQWGKDKYGKDSVSIEFDYEGYFTKLFLLAKCLDGRSKIKTENGYKRISQLFTNNYRGKIYCLNNENELVLSSVKNIFKIPLNNRKLFKVRLINSHNKTKRTQGAILTEDHKILTSNGWKTISLLTSNDKIHTGKFIVDKDIQEALWGMIFGDAKIEHGLLKCSHSTKQEEYLNFKAQLFNSFERIKSYEIKLKQTNKLYYGKKFTVKEVSPIYKLIENNFYVKKNEGKFRRKKTITESNIKNYSLISLAFHFMDDGYLRQERFYDSEICTVRYSLNEVQILSKRIKELGIENSISKKRRIKFTVKNTKILSELIAPFVPVCMNYKILKEHWNIQKYKFSNKLVPFYDNF